MNEQRIVIIGSGFGGLSCALLLARAGRRVVVLERQQQPGGCLQSYRRGDYSFDTGMHYVGGLAEGQPLHQLFDELGLLQLPWHRLDADGFDRVTIAGETFAFAEGYDHFAETLAMRFPADREALYHYTRLLRNLPSVMEIGEVPAYQYLTENFSDQLLVNVLGGTSLKTELRRESLPLFHFAHGNSSFIQSSWRLEGNGNLIVRKLIDGIHANGGEVFCGCEVNELIEHEGRITAACCTNGETFAGDLFISDIHPAQTFELIHESQILKRLFRRRINALKNTCGMFTVSLVLKPRAIEYFNHNKYIYREANVWDEPIVNDVDRVMVSARVPSADSQEEGRYCAQIDLLTPMSWSQCEAWMNTTVGQRGEDYKEMKQRMAEACIKLAEGQLPGLGSAIDRLYTSTPLTYRDYNQAPCGTAYGLRKDCHSLLTTMLSPHTPITNLLLTGQNLILHGLEGVAMTARLTADEALQTT